MTLFGAAGIPSAKAAQWSEAGGLTSIPYGHKEYCNRNPRNCGAHRVLPPMKLTPQRMKLLQSVSSSVNHRIKPVSDQENYGKRDYWTMPVNGKGDCEDYVLMKRAQLMARVSARHSFSSPWYKAARRMSFWRCERIGAITYSIICAMRYCRWKRHPIAISRCSHPPMPGNGSRLQDALWLLPIIDRCF